jgi:hypothetical protein
MTAASPFSQTSFTLQKPPHGRLKRPRSFPFQIPESPSPSVRTALEGAAEPGKRKPSHAPIAQKPQKRSNFIEFYKPPRMKLEDSGKAHLLP